MKKVVPKYLENLTEDQRAHLFRTELSSEREAGAMEWEKELARREKEEEDRRKAKALYRSEKMAQALEHGKEIQRQRQEEFEKSRRRRSREPEAKARRVSLQPVSDQPALEAVTLTPAPAAASEAVTLTPATAAASAANPATPPEALQAPITEEELAYRRDLHEHLSKFSDEV